MTIRLPDDLRRSLVELGRQRHQSLSEVTRDLIRRQVALEQFRAARARIVPLAEAAGFLTDEDVFNAVS